MPNIIDATGLHVKTRDELIAEYTAAYQDIYGADINLGTSTPDGQMMNIQVQAILDLQDLVVQNYNNFDPDFAIGQVLDMRCAINGIQRQGGTYTLTNITITADRALNLQGLDADVDNADGVGYTVSDAAGNNWILVTSQVISVAGTYVYQFRARNPGEVLSVPNTIQIPITVVLGVTSINNPTTYTSLGENQETDAAYKIRRQKSVAISSQGYMAGLLAALLNINGVTAAFIYENVTGSTDADSIPSHSIWVIVNGGANAEIASAIYAKRNAGCGMKGSVTYDVTQPDGTLFTIKWDIVVPENLYIEFDAQSLNGTDSIDVDSIADGLVLSFVPGVNEQVNINDLATDVQDIDNNVLVTGAGFSLSAMGTYTPALSPSAKNKQFAVEADHIAITVIETISFSGVPSAGNWTINFRGNPTSSLAHNANAAAIQAALRLVSGLGAITVTGNYTDGFIVRMVSVVGVVPLMTIDPNTTGVTITVS